MANMKLTNPPELQTKVAESCEPETKQESFDLAELLDLPKKVVETPEKVVEPQPEKQEIVVETQINDENSEQLTTRKEMTMNDFIKQIISEQKVQQKELAEKLGMKSQSGITQALQRDMRMSMVLRFLNALDCELVVQSKGEETIIVD